MKKELYVQPALAKHELLRDITAKRSGYGSGPGPKVRFKVLLSKVLSNLPR